MVRHSLVHQWIGNSKPLPCYVESVQMDINNILSKSRLHLLLAAEKKKKTHTSYYKAKSVTALPKTRITVSFVQSTCYHYFYDLVKLLAGDFGTCIMCCCDVFFS